MSNKMRPRSAGLLWVVAAVVLIFVATVVVMSGSLGSPSDNQSKATAAIVPRTTGPQISNVTDVAFTVTWLTAQPTTGKLRWGVSSQALDRVTEDSRGVGVVSETHSAEVFGLESGKIYYFDVISGAIVEDNGGQHYQVTTGPTLGMPGVPTVVFGRLFGRDGSNPVQGAILTAVVSDSETGGSTESQPVSAVSARDGAWALELSVRTADLKNYYATVARPRFVHIRADAGSAGQASEVVRFGDSDKPLKIYLR